MRLVLEEGNSASGEFPDGIVFTAEIVSIKEVEKPWTDKYTGEQAKRWCYEFKILDGGFEGRRHWEDLFPGFYVSNKCKPYVWLLKVMNRDELPEGFVFDTESMEGQKVPIVFGTRTFTKKDGTEGSQQYVEVLSEDEAQGLRATQPTSAPAFTPAAKVDPLDEPF